MSDGIALSDLSNGTQQKVFTTLRFWNETQDAARRKGDIPVPGPSDAEIVQSHLFLTGPKLDNLPHPEWVTDCLNGLPYDLLTLTVKNDNDLR